MVSSFCFYQSYSLLSIKNFRGKFFLLGIGGSWWYALRWLSRWPWGYCRGLRGSHRVDDKCRVVSSVSQGVLDSPYVDGFVPKGWIARQGCQGRGLIVAWLAVGQNWNSLVVKVSRANRFSSMTTRRDRRGYGSIALGVAALAAVTGAVYWYLNHGQQSLGSIWNRPNIRTKRKTVIVVLNKVSLWMSQVDVAAYS